MLRAVLALFSAVLIVSLLLFSPASADTGTTTVSNGSVKTWELDVKKSFHLSYDIEVTDGPAVNVLLLTADDYDQFVANGTYSSIDGGSYLDTSHAAADLDMNGGSYVLVVENAATGTGSTPTNVTAALSYQLDVRESQQGSSLVLVLFIGVIIIFGMVMIVLADVMIKRKK